MSSKGAPGRIQTATRPQMRQAAGAFVKRWQGETRERAEKDTFWNEFLAIFGLDRRRVGVFEYVAKRYTTGRTGFMDLLVPGQMAVEHKSDAGKPGETEAQRDIRLDVAMDQLVDYLLDLKPRDAPQVLVVCDFHWFRVRDMESGTDVTFALTDLVKHVDDFAFLAGYARQASMEPEEAANLRATAHLGRLHDALVANKYPGHDLRVLLTRLLYILFADDTAVWTRNLFYDWLLVHTADDGSDLGSRLNDLFQVLDTDYGDRQAGLPVDLREFAYINGGLFQENIRTPHCDREMREHLLDACAFEWSAISPAIFGSLFQGVMDTQQRRELGAHYTSERDILRTIKPLFLDELDERVAKAKALGDRQARLRALRTLRDSLGQLRFLDPACGCGNFLMLSYKELRRVELECLVAIREAEAGGTRAGTAGLGQAALDVSIESVVHVGQFYGIELEEFPARIAETAMHLVDHQANLALSEALGDYYVRLPIRDTAHITVDNALRLDWEQVLPADECSYVLGNPPFAGQYSKTAAQVDDLKLVWGKSYNGYLDYVTGWYTKAASYVGKRGIRIAFVSTNSICQGEPVAALWEPLFDQGFRIDFAHRTFLWRSEASSPAGVHVVVIGWSIDDGSTRTRTLFDYQKGGRGEPRDIRQVRNINAYLVDAPNVIARPRSTPLSHALPDLFYGSKVGDGGFLLVKPKDYPALAADPYARKYLRRFIGARELIHAEDKWCLWMQDLLPDDLKQSPLLRARIDAVQKYRLEPGRDKEIQEAAVRPATFLRNKQPREPYLAIPAHFSENHPYFPIARFSADVITGNHNFVAADPDGVLFAMLSSRMFVTWMRAMSGRIGANLRFSKTLAWHNFPIPALSVEDTQHLIDGGKLVLEARAAFPDRSLADLYESVNTPVPVLDAHKRLDKVVDNLIGGKRRTVKDDVDRLAVLMERFAILQQAGQINLTPKPVRRKP